MDPIRSTPIYRKKLNNIGLSSEEGGQFGKYTKFWHSSNYKGIGLDKAMRTTLQNIHDGGQVIHGKF